jgi:hypothetical protein
MATPGYLSVAVRSDPHVTPWQHEQQQMATYRYSQDPADRFFKASHTYRADKYADSPKERAQSKEEQ